MLSILPNKLDVLFYSYSEAFVHFFWQVFQPSLTEMAVPEDASTQGAPPQKDSQPRFVIGCSDEDFEEALEENEVSFLLGP